MDIHLFYVEPYGYYAQDEVQRIYQLIQKGFAAKVKQGYGLWFPMEIPVSKEAKDLMARLMKLDLSKRLTAKEALQHSWILNQGKSSKQEIKKDQKSKPK